MSFHCVRVEHGNLSNEDIQNLMHAALYLRATKRESCLFVSERRQIELIVTTSFDEQMAENFIGTAFEAHLTKNGSTKRIMYIVKLPKRITSKEVLTKMLEYECAASTAVN